MDLKQRDDEKELIQLFNDIQSNANIGTPNWSGIDRRISATRGLLLSRQPTESAAPQWPEGESPAVRSGEQAKVTAVAADQPTAEDAELMNLMLEVSDLTYQHHTVHVPAILRKAASRLSALSKPRVREEAVKLAKTIMAEVDAAAIKGIAHPYYALHGGKLWMLAGELLRIAKEEG